MKPNLRSKPRQSGDAQRLRLSEKLGFAAGTIAGSTPTSIIHLLINPIFNITMGVSPALLSSAAFIQTMWYTMVVPFVGQYSDNFRSRLGRRKPLMIFAILPLSLSFAALWFFPRAMSPFHIVAYFVSVSLVFYFLDAVYSVSLAALIVEATDDYRERVRINVFVQLVVFVASIAIQWIFPLMQARKFSSSIEGLRVFAVVFGIVNTVVALVPLALTTERLYGIARHQPKRTMIDNFSVILRNRPFAILTAIRALFTFSYNIVSVLGLYINYYYIYGGNIKAAAVMQGWNGTVFQLAAIVSLPLFRHIAMGGGKGRAMACAAGFLAVGSFGKLILYVPMMPWLQLFIYVANGAAGAGSVTMVNAALADVADYDEIKTGARREGSYVAALAWFERVGNSVGSLISGFILVWIGFDAKLGGAQPPMVMKTMQFVYFAIPFLGACAIIYLAGRYPLDERICNKMKFCLKNRRSDHLAVIAKA